FERNAVLFHAASNPHDEPFARLSIEVEHRLIPLASSRARHRYNDRQRMVFPEKTKASRTNCEALLH
ncbi:hypothetical protein, partial [Paraburkholderia sp.]|uniref:hypothetical protein n=1 Tax=Paraburkholderia sp. TaxID=1926495 RepID=UPI0039C94FE0